MLLASPFDTVFGLPVHALVVHAVVVLVPLAALGAIGAAVVPRWSVRFGPLLAMAALVAAGAAFVAKESGEQLEARVGDPGVHAELGTWLPWIALGLLAGVVVLWRLDRSGAGRPRTGLTRAVSVLVLLVSLLAVGWTIRVGHTGAQAVWGPVVDSTTNPGG